jgi:hypothetical protein
VGRVAAAETCKAIYADETALGLAAGRVYGSTSGQMELVATKMHPIRWLRTKRQRRDADPAQLLRRSHWAPMCGVCPIRTHDPPPPQPSSPHQNTTTRRVLSTNVLRDHILGRDRMIEPRICNAVGRSICHSDTLTASQPGPFPFCG